MRLALAAVLALGPCTKSEPPVPTDPPPPITSATTPPAWQPPEPATSVSVTAPPTSVDLPKARAAAEQKDWKKVRALLEKKVRAGKALTEEAQLELDACIASKDKACAEAVHAKYPELLAR